MIDSLFKRVSDTEDDGIMRYNASLSLSVVWSQHYMERIQGLLFYWYNTLVSFYLRFVIVNFRELLLDFYTSSGKRKPDQIIIFR